MTQPKICTFLILLLGLTVFSFGQTKKSEQQLDKYYQQLKLSNVDTILLIKSGCTGCDVRYSDTSTSVIDGQSIYVLTQKNGQYNLAIFDDIHNAQYLATDTCSLFSVINKSKSVLDLKDVFYRKELAELKKSKFLPPRPAHHSFEELIIQMPTFKYEFVINGENADYLGVVRENEKWFQATKNIVERFFNYSQSIKR